MRIAPIVVVVVAAALLRGSVALAHGDLDQTLDGDGGCNPFNFPVPVTQAGGQRQEFVPSQPGLSSVGVCASPDSGPTEIDIIVREGSATSPGAVIGGGSVVVNLTEFAHVDFLSVIPVTPGETYVIEIAASLDVTLHGMPPDADIYADGASNMTGVVSDFAFRTYSGQAPATLTPTVTKTGTATRTRTPSVTPTPSPTMTALAIETPTPPPPVAGETPPVEPSIVAAGSTPPPASTAASSPTRTSGVLGGARRAGMIRFPDVGDGSGTSTSAPGGIVALAMAGVVTLVAGVVRTRRRSTLR